MLIDHRARQPLSGEPGRIGRLGRDKRVSQSLRSAPYALSGCVAAAVPRPTPAFGRHTLTPTGIINRLERRPW